jgi:hypothetical protein
MIVLVDYDNIEKPMIRLGVSHVVNSIISKINPTDVGTGNRHVTIRFYGGWYENNRFTNRAQALSLDIARDFPATSYLADKTTAVIVKCELAYSLLADPGNHLFHTFRSKGVPDGLKAEHPGLCGCTQHLCPIIETYNFVSNGRCSKCGTVSPKDIFYRGEQKLVDTMLTSDLIFSSKVSNRLCVVSSDDDFWPGIVTTLKSGSNIVHIHTKAGRRTPTFYSKSAGSAYTERNL